jgi:D-xylose transport system ATP-binding protein
VFDLSNRISVMYHGRLVDTVERENVTPDEVLAMIILGKKPQEASSEELAKLQI